MGQKWVKNGSKVGQELGQKWVKNWVKFGSKSGSRGSAWAIKNP